MKMEGIHIGENKNEGQTLKQRPKRMTMIIVLIIVAVLAIVLYLRMNDTLEKSKVDGVSDEVYEQLVHFYFYTTTFMEILLDSHERDEKVDPSWIEEHELYEQAEAYAKSNDVRAQEVFPNPLFIEYFRNPDAYNKTEQEYIEKMYEFIETFQRVNVDEHEVLKKELKNELNIKDSYSPFDEIK